MSAGRGLLFCFAPSDGSHNNVNFYVHERGFLPWSHPTQRLKVQKIVLVGQGQAFGVPKSNRTFTALHIKIRYRAPFFSGHILRKISTFFGECIALFEVLFGSIGYSVSDKCSFLKKPPKIQTNRLHDNISDLSTILFYFCFYPASFIQFRDPAVRPAPRGASKASR